MTAIGDGRSLTFATANGGFGATPPFAQSYWLCGWSAADVRHLPSIFDALVFSAISLRIPGS